MDGGGEDPAHIKVRKNRITLCCITCVLHRVCAASQGGQSVKVGISG